LRPLERVWPAFSRAKFDSITATGNNQTGMREMSLKQRRPAEEEIIFSS